MQAPDLLAGEAFEALIFDCDGTLVDTVAAHFVALNEALRQVGLMMPAEWYRTRTGLAPGALLEALADERGTPLDVPALLDHYVGVYLANLDRLREIPVVADLARAYHGRVPLAVASNGARANVGRTLEVTGLRGLFDQLVAIEDVTRGKPAPDIYWEAARRLGVRPSDCIVFEDTDEGLTAARAAGMRTRDVRAFVTSSI